MLKSDNAEMNTDAQKSSWKENSNEPDWSLVKERLLVSPPLAQVMVALAVEKEENVGVGAVSLEKAQLQTSKVDRGAFQAGEMVWAKPMRAVHKSCNLPVLLAQFCGVSFES